MTAFEQHQVEARQRLRASGLTRSGPGSITWKVNREVIVVASWGRAVLLQLAHPSVAAGVHGHSTFRGSLRSGLTRMQSTVRAMLSITFGDEEQMIAAAAAVNCIHDRVCGRLREGTDERYSAHDPEPQRWVHATLLESIMLTYELLVEPLTPRERDQYCAEAAIMEPLLGLQPGWLPRDAAQLESYLREMLTERRVVISETSRELARAVLYPPHWYVAWPMFRVAQLLAIGSLPPSIRESYGFRWHSRDQKAFARCVALLRTSTRLLPPFVREWPVARRQILKPYEKVTPLHCAKISASMARSSKSRRAPGELGTTEGKQE